MGIRPDDMLVFAAVVRGGSFTRAATELGMTKQSVSERIARLEATLKVRLLERTTRRLRPTDVGASYAEECQAIATQIDEANDTVQRRQLEPVGRLRLASPTLFGRRFLAPILARYLQQYPRVVIEVTLTDRPADLIGDGFDLAIQIGRLKDSSFTARKLGDGLLYYVASPAYLREFGMPTPETLATSRCLGFFAQESWRVDDLKVSVLPVAVINNLESLCDIAIAGAGIARLPSLVCREAVADGRLVRLFPESRTQVRPISAIYPSRTFLPTRVTRFLDLLSAMVTPMSTR